MCVVIAMAALALGVSPWLVGSHLAVVVATAVGLLVARARVTAPIAVPLDAVSAAGELRAMQQRLRLATSTADIEMWEYDLTSRSFVWFENRLASLGLQDVPLASYIEEFEHYTNQEDRARARELIAQTIRDGETQCAYEYRFLRDGRTIHVRDCIHVLRDANGRAARLIGTGRDITTEVETRELLNRQAGEERMLRDRLSVATAAAGIEVWEFDLRSAQFTWMMNRLPAFGLQQVPIDAYGEAWNAIVPLEDQLLIQQDRKSVV